VPGSPPVEAWAGVTAATRRETIANLEWAMKSGAHAAVVAPLSIQDVVDVVEFFQRDVSDAFERFGGWVPVFLYDNADIAANPRIPHIRTRDVKRLSRLPFIFGVKVSASRRVLGNYTKGAAHFKDKGEFGIYVGNAMLMFRVFAMRDGLAGRVSEYWNRYLLRNELPIGVVSGPANVWPREWQQAWRACYSGDDGAASAYRQAFLAFEEACRFNDRGRVLDKTIACLKYALKLDGVIESDLVASGSPSLSDSERAEFYSKYQSARGILAAAPRGTGKPTS
jgi:dihydrodipicolinate synthase/N-acetylneuraminate lyase